MEGKKMKHNRIHQRALALLLSLSLVFGIFAIDTVGASAASDSGNPMLRLNSDARIAKSLDDGNITIIDSGRYVITQRDSGHPVTNTISVTSGAPDIELENVNIDASSNSTNQCAFSIASGAAVTLTLDGTNTLKSGGNWSGLWVPASTATGVSDASLTITEQSTGSLNAIGGDNGAGIGGGNNDSCGSVAINGGTVIAQGGVSGAGIGGGNGWVNYYATDGGNGGNIAINGGTVTANGGNGGAGIGGGGSGNGTGIGGMISISGGTVTATGSHYSAGIGGGNGANGTGTDGTISISGGDVTANSLSEGAGIGGGACGNGTGDYGTISVSGGTVTANGGNCGAGIGGGNDTGGREGGNGTGTHGKILVTGGTVTANSGSGSAGIGGGDGDGNGGGNGTGVSGEIAISGGTVTANGDSGGAGIGGGNGNGYCYGVGIGGGNGSGTNGKISIQGGTVTANGGNNSAGIGGGNSQPGDPSVSSSGYGTGGDITITGADTEVTAKGQNAYDIGAGASFAVGGTLTVSDGATVIWPYGTNESTSYRDCFIITGSGSNRDTYYNSDGAPAVHPTMVNAALTAEPDANGGIKLTAKATNGSSAVSTGSFTFAYSYVLNGEGKTHTENANIDPATGTASCVFDDLPANGFRMLTAKYRDFVYPDLDHADLDYTDFHPAYDALITAFCYLPDAIDLSTVSTGGYGGCYTYSGNTVTLAQNGWYVFSGETTEKMIKVPSGVSASATLDNASIDVSGNTNRCAFSLDPGAAVNLILKNTNMLTSGGTCAGLRVPSGNVNTPDASLTIFGQSTDDSLNVTAGREDNTYNAGAGIGGSCRESGGKITISGGDVHAVGVFGGAGIGGGYAGNADTVIIIGGKVQASGAFGSTGIGGGYYGGIGNAITISGGDVQADGGDGGAGIGSGCYATSVGGAITISGGKVQARGGDNSAGIGGGKGCAGGTVQISGNAEVHAYAQGGFDIGSGFNDAGGTLSGGTLTVAGTDLANGPQVELEAEGINATKPDDALHQFTNCKIWGSGANDAGSHNIRGYYDANGKILLNITLSAAPKNSGSRVFGSPVTLTAKAIRFGFYDNPSLHGQVTFVRDGNRIGSSVSIPDGVAAMDWTPTDAAEHQLTAQYNPTDDDAYIENSANIVSYSAGRATPEVIAPTTAEITYGTKLSDVPLLNGSAKDGESAVLGSFSWEQPDRVPTVPGGIYDAVFSPTDRTNYNQVFTVQVHVNVAKAATTVTTPPTASQILSSSKLSASTFTGGTVTDSNGTTILGTFAWAQRDRVVTASGNYDAIFTPNDPTDYNTALVSVNVTVTAAPSNNSNSSGTPASSLPSGVTDTMSNAQADLSGATMPSGVTSVTLSVTPEAVTPTTPGTAIPTAPGAAGGAADLQAAAALHLAVSNPGLNIIGTPVLYNIKLLDQNGNPITGFSGKVTVKIPLPAGMHGVPHVFRYEESTGTLTDMNAVVENGFLVFSTEHFSYYTVAGVGDSITLDTKDYSMPVNGSYQIGLKLTGSKAASVKVTSTNGKVAAAVRLKSGNVQVTGKGTRTAYIMIDVYDSKNHLLTHASVKVEVKTGIRPRGDSTRQIGVF